MLPPFRCRLFWLWSRASSGVARHFPMEELVESLTAEAGIEVMSGEYPTAVTDALGQDLVFVGRIRAEETNHNSLELWVVFDQARKEALPTLSRQPGLC